MSSYPPKLTELIEDFQSITDRTERAEALIEIADRFPGVRVPGHIAQKPYPEENHVTFCESDAYVWAIDNPDGTVKFYFDVLNPQGLSAMAMSVVLDEAYSNQPLDYAAALDTGWCSSCSGVRFRWARGRG
ncbi:MAG: hypothetical protein HND48_01735 [Chloroflexi bacterium]|nr:hypothetical protein [Chloroflexota bacterium]